MFYNTQCFQIIIALLSVHKTYFQTATVINLFLLWTKSKIWMTKIVLKVTVL